MTVIVTIFSLIFFHFIYVISLSSECKSTSTFWTYYPCSFMISSPLFYCQQASTILPIDECLNGEITIFWHFPSGNMTITMKSDKNQPFLLHLLKMSSLKKKLIKNIYHLVNNKTTEEKIINVDDDQVINIPSDEYNQCSIKFETSNRIIFDYGTLIRMTISTSNNYIS
ncbi:unnamed protein product [Rotaria socialis]|uniref:Uncharacterized protein n=2 Tax=Rotaria socialis TaxID=392032 RepID=A0A818N936_9BILA|nr:unnamed protein product [Rotaria socialis]